MQQETLDAAETYLRQHQSELLADDGLAVMALLAQTNSGNPNVRDHQQRLLQARELGLDQMYAGIRRERLQQRIQEVLTEHGPIGRAVYQFMQMADDEQAARLLPAQGDLLLTWDAGHLLNQLLPAASAAGDQTLAARLQIRWQQWQAAWVGPTSGPTLTVTEPKQQLAEPESTAKYEIGLAAFTAIGDNAVTLNVLNFGAVRLKWQRPHMARRDLTEKAVGRVAELHDDAAAVLDLLQRGHPQATSIPQHQALLQRCRELGIEAAYQEFTNQI
jgi:hypothetical protein